MLNLGRPPEFQAGIACYYGETHTPANRNEIDAYTYVFLLAIFQFVFLWTEPVSLISLSLIWSLPGKPGLVSVGSMNEAMLTIDALVLYSLSTFQMTK